MNNIQYIVYGGVTKHSVS